MNRTINSAVLSPLARLFRRLDDAVNPIAVKELRQAVQARYISSVLLLLLIGQLAAMTAVVLSRGVHEIDVGQRAFLVLFGVLTFSCMVFLPLYVSGRLFAERVAADADLFSLTGLRPRAIVWGRLSSGLLLTVLIYAASAPFLAFTLLLRGVDRSSVFALLLAGFVGTAFLIQFAVFLACLPLPRPLRLLLWLVTLGSGFFGFLFFIIVAVTFLEDRWATVHGDYSAVFWAALVVGVVAVGFLFVLSVALVSPRTANRVFPVRLFMTIVWPFSLAAAVFVSLRLSLGIPVWLWMAASVGFCTLGLGVAISERDSPGPRVARAIPRSPWLRPLAFVFYTGSAGGVVWCSLMIALSLGAAAALEAYILSLAHPYRSLSWPSFVPYWDLLAQETPIVRTSALGILFVFAYCMTALVIRRWFLPKLSACWTWVLALGVAAAAFAGPVLVYWVIRVSDPYATNWLACSVTNPLILFHREPGVRVLGGYVAGVWAACTALLNAPWAIERYRSFRRCASEADRERTSATNE